MSTVRFSSLFGEVGPQSETQAGGPDFLSGVSAGSQVSQRETDAHAETIKSLDVVSWTC